MGNENFQTSFYITKGLFEIYMYIEVNLCLLFFPSIFVFPYRERQEDEDFEAIMLKKGLMTAVR